MRTSKPFILALPKGIINKLNEALESARPNFSYKIEYFYYVVNYLIVKDITNKNDEYHALNRTILEASTSKMINQYITYLKNHSIILSDNIYQAGVKALHYKLNPDYLHGASYVEIGSNTKLHDSLVKKSRLRNKNVNRLEPHLKAMRKEFMNLDLDYESAIKCVEKQSSSAHLITSLLMLQDKRLRYFKRNSTNQRLDTNITNLKSNLRPFFSGDYVSIDLKNSQPFFLIMLIKEILKEGNIRIDTKKYDHILNVHTFIRNTLCNYISYQLISIVSKIPQNSLFEQNEELLNLEKGILKGKFYDDLQTSFKTSRKEVKQLMFEILFSRNSINNSFIPFGESKKIFASKYPLFAEIIKKLKSEKYKNLAIYLQNLESYIFIDIISKKLVEQGIIPLTIHDSIIVDRKYQDKAIEIVREVFLEAFGVIPSFHIKPLKERTMRKVKLRRRYPDAPFMIRAKKQNKRTHKHYLNTEEKQLATPIQH